MRHCWLGLGIGEEIMGQTLQHFWPRSSGLQTAFPLWADLGWKLLYGWKVRTRCSCVYLPSAQVRLVTDGPLLKWRISAAWEKDLAIKSWRKSIVCVWDNGLFFCCLWQLLGAILATPPSAYMNVSLAHQHRKHGELFYKKYRVYSIFY